MSITHRDKVRGAIFGYALGDALGLGTELMSVDEVKAYYPQKLRHFNQIIRDAHRSQWEPGSWAYDTEMLLIQIDSVIANKRVDTADMAHRMQDWYDNGVNDVTSIYRWLFTDPHWVDDPFETAHRIWSRKMSEASNEAIYRAIVAGLTSRAPLLDDIRDLVLFTHNDSRCVSSAILIAKMAKTLMWEDRETEFDDLRKICRGVDSRTTPYLEMARDGKLEDFKLDDEDTFWFTRKAMGAALWTLWHCESPEEILYMLVDAGGDANTNAALALSLAGIKYGYEALPELVKELKGYERIEDAAERLNEYIDKEIKPLYTKD